MNRWSDCDGDEHVGMIGFVVESVNNNNGGAARWDIREDPAHTNRSHEPRLRGWCGETNNISVYARGMGRVIRITRSGARALVQEIAGAELAAALEETGYPELTPDE